MDIAWPHRPTPTLDFLKCYGGKSVFSTPNGTPLWVPPNPEQLPRAWKRSKPSFKSNRPSHDPTARILPFKSTGRSPTSINPPPKPSSPPRASPSTFVSVDPRPTSSLLLHRRFSVSVWSWQFYFWVFVAFFFKKISWNLFCARCVAFGGCWWCVFVGFARISESAAGGLHEFQACYCWRWRHW